MALAYGQGERRIGFFRMPQWYGFTKVDLSAWTLVAPAQGSGLVLKMAQRLLRLLSECTQGRAD